MTLSIPQNLKLQTQRANAPIHDIPIVPNQFPVGLLPLHQNPPIRGPKDELIIPGDHYATDSAIADGLKIYNTISDFQGQQKYVAPLVPNHHQVIIGGHPQS